MILVIKDKGHLAITQALTLLRAVEDNVFHFAAAKRLSALFTEHPTHRIGQVRLAAAIGAYDTRNALVKDNDCPVRKRLEAVNFQSF